MIGRLEGVLLEQRADAACSSTSDGVGYEVFIPLSTFAALPDAGKTVALRIHTHVREDALQLFGFATALERDARSSCCCARAASDRSSPRPCSRASSRPISSRRFATANPPRCARCPGVGREDRGAHRSSSCAIASSELARRVRDGGRRAGRVAAREPTRRAQALSALREPRHPRAAGGARRSSASRRASRDGRRVETWVRAALREARAMIGVRRASAASCRGARCPRRRSSRSALRPRTLAEMIGQDRLRENLARLHPRRARARRAARPHPVLRPAGPRQDLARARRRARARRAAPHDERPRDRAPGRPRGAALEPRGRRRAVHRRDPPARARRRGDPLSRDGGLPARPPDRRGPGARSMRLDLPRFTLVGATTRAGLLTSPLRDRFGWTARLDYYPPDDLERDPAALGAAARRSSSTPRRAARSRAARAARRASRTACCAACATSRQVRRGRGADVDGALAALRARAPRRRRRGLRPPRPRLLLTLIEKFDGGPVGIETLAAALGEERGTLEDVVEPFLIQDGFLARTPRGRVGDAALLPAPRAGSARCLGSAEAALGSPELPI